MEQEHILNTHIDTLTEWWENADKGTPNAGDTIIRYNPADGPNFIILVADEVDADGNDPECWGTRILSRAPKPKPAWHEARAVIAKGQDEWDHREAFTRSDDYPETRWVCNQGVTFKSEDLFDVTPLIEQKVTDEMVERVIAARDYNGQPYTASHHDAQNLLAAVLGLESA